MKKLLLILLCLPLLIKAQTIKKVLLIGIDGCRADALELANTPTIDNLIANGVYSPDALNDDITISGPGWSAILCGVWSGKHLSVDNSLIVNNIAIIYNYRNTAYWFASFSNKLINFSV